MDFNELNMLEVIQKREQISQREIASEIGISLGMVNILIKKFIHVGFVKIERLNGNKIKYLLTSQGFAFLTKKTITYIAQSYKSMMQIKDHMVKIIEKNYAIDESVAIFGGPDEVRAILVDVLKSNQFDYFFVDRLDQVDKFLHWDIELDKGIFLLDGV